MILRQSFGLATGKTAVQITALLVGQLQLAGLKPAMVRSTDQATAGRFAPLSLLAPLRQGVSHCRELRACFIYLGGGEIVLGELKKLRSDDATRRRRVAVRAVTRREKPDGERENGGGGRSHGRSLSARRCVRVKRSPNPLYSGR